MRIWTLLLLALWGLTASAQVQKGYVKTKGTLTAEGVKTGQRVPGVLISIKGVPNSVVSKGNKASFSFHVPSATYYLQAIEKQGYVLADADLISQPLAYSDVSPLVIVVEDEEAHRKELTSLTRRIRRTMSAELQKREDEIDALREQNRISEQERLKLLEQLNNRQENNEKLIGSMARHFVGTDYDMVSDEDRLINRYILEGQLDKADSLLKSKGDISQRVEEVKQSAATVEALERQARRERQQMERKRNSVADDCFSLHLIAVSRYQNDSALYYLEQRSQLDTTNVNWLLKVGNFASDYLADYEKALYYYDKAVEVATAGNNRKGLMFSYYDKGALFGRLGKYDLAKNYYKKATDLLSEDTLGMNGYMRAQIYEALGVMCSDEYRYDEAEEYYLQSLELKKRLMGDDSEQVAISYMNLASLYRSIENYELALQKYEQAYNILEKLPESYPSHLAYIFGGQGIIYSKQNDYTRARACYDRELELKKKLFGEDHPRLATSYSNLSLFYSRLADFQKAADYLDKAEAIWRKYYGEKSNYLITLCANRADMMRRKGDYQAYADWTQKGYEMSAELYGEDSNMSRTILANLYVALHTLAQKVPTEQNKERLRLFLTNRLITANVAPKGVAESKGMHGEYVLLEYCGWTIENTDECMFLLIEPTANKPKDILFLKDGKTEHYQFPEGRMGVWWQMKTVSAEERQKVMDLYHKWKTTK